MSTNHGSCVDIPKRPLTRQEAGWVHDIVSANQRWFDVEITNLYAIKKCTCGCRSIVFENPSKVQNPGLIGHQGLVGEISLNVRTQDNKDDVISVLLHFAEGSLTLLEVVWYNFPEPVPAVWTEVGRHISVDGS